MNNTVLVIGAGVAGMEASLVLARAGRTVHLVEKSSIIGGQVIKCEEVFPDMECATCMVSPMQQEVLQHSNIELHTLSEITDIRGKPGDIHVRIRKQARYVDATACIGCGSCTEACPESTTNDFEEGMVERKAIAVPCAGALPNVPHVNTDICRRFNGNECNICVEACMFAAVDFSRNDEEIELETDAVIIATGFSTGDPTCHVKTGNGDHPGIYSAWEMERLFASNGPTEGKIILRDGRVPRSAAIIHCVDRSERGYCSSICCLYSLKFVRYLRSKLDPIEIIELHKDLCLPGKRAQHFADTTFHESLRLIRYSDITIHTNGEGVAVKWKDQARDHDSADIDMVILVPSVMPGKDTKRFASLMGLKIDDQGFFAHGDSISSEENDLSGGVFIAGAAMGPMDVAQSVSSADAVSGMILSRFNETGSADDE